MNSGVYIIGLRGTRYLKIGVSRDVEKRVRELQTGAPVPVVLHAYEIVSDARKVERIAHSSLEQFRTCGEWFACSLRRARRVLDVAITMAHVDQATCGAPAPFSVVHRIDVLSGTEKREPSQKRPIVPPGDVDAAIRFLIADGWSLEQILGVLKARLRQQIIQTWREVHASDNDNAAA